MDKRQIGNTDLYTAPVVLGCNVFGWTISDESSHKLLDEFTEAGLNMIDTADIYSRWHRGNKGGESETIIGDWFQNTGKRKDVIISTKVGGDMGNGKKGVTKKYIIEAAEASLKRLQTDYIDLLSTHFDEEATPVEETMAAYDELIKAGKVRWAGTSNMSAARIMQSLDVSKKNNWPAYAVLQPLYNLLEREKFEKEYQQLCIENSIGVLTYFSLASGFLSGKYRSAKDLKKSTRGSDMDKHFNKRSFAILDALNEIAETHYVRASTVALTWLMTRPGVTAPIASVTTTAQMLSLQCAAYLHLNAEEIKLLDDASSY